MKSMCRSLFRVKPIEDHHSSTELKRCLTAFDLTLLGIGAIIGAGIFVLTGIAAATKAGPALTLSYGLAALACGFAAFAYAELASCIGGCGSAYGYAYAGLGELIAWLIGWFLLLEYGMACSAVSVGWSGYVDNALSAIGIHIPAVLLDGPWEGGIIDLPAVFIVLFIASLLFLGVKHSARVNAIVVYIKLTAILIFIAIASFHFDISNWHPFFPFGLQGITNGAAFIFFAYIGFDAVSTAAEETIHPQRDLPIGIITSLAICAVVFMVVTAILTGAASYTTLNVDSPVSELLLRLGYRIGAAIVALGAIAGLTTVILVMYYGLTRVCLAMSRDRLLPHQLAAINPQTQTPGRIIVLTAIIMAILGGLLPIRHLAEVVNIGTLAAFSTVCIGVIILRITKPDLPRPFKTPYSPLIPCLGALFCIYLMLNLPLRTWEIFLIWSAAGLLFYFFYGRRRSLLNYKTKICNC